jgi:hypothetical protein
MRLKLLDYLATATTTLPSTCCCLWHELLDSVQRVRRVHRGWPAAHHERHSDCLQQLLARGPGLDRVVHVIGDATSAIPATVTLGVICSN